MTRCFKLGCCWPIHEPYTVLGSQSAASTWCALHAAESFVLRAETVLHQDTSQYARTLARLRVCPEWQAARLWQNVPAEVRCRIDCSACVTPQLQ